MGVYREHGVKWLDALVLTHDHMDAVGGLDELRSLQMYNQQSFDVTSEIRAFCDRRTLTRLKHMFPYLFSKASKRSAPFDVGLCQCCELEMEPAPALTSTPSPPVASATAAPAANPAAASAAASAAAAPEVKRFVAKVGWESFGATDGGGNPLPQISTFDAFGLQVHALPIQHGLDYICFGFGFGPRDARVVYLSDYTALLPPTEALLSEWSAEGSIALLVLDALRLDDSHPVHASLAESVLLAKRLRPQRTLLVGMGHTLEHDATNAELRKRLKGEDLDVQLAYDSQFVPLSFF